MGGEEEREPVRFLTEAERATVLCNVIMSSSTGLRSGAV